MTGNGHRQRTAGGTGSPGPGTPASPEQDRGRRWLPWAATAGRLLLAGVWIVSAVLKIGDPAQAVRAVRAYRLLPESVVPAAGYGLPFLELAVGVLLLAGVAARLTSVLSAVLVAAFMVGIGAAWARGLRIDCGCFSQGGDVGAGQTRYPQEMARDAGLLVVSLALARWPRSRLSLSGLLDPHDPTREPK
jgi:uncharacterized membrane protein YphA (DoxX/SURF4 family)